MNDKALALLAFLAILPLAGCHARGPKAIGVSHASYNEIINRTNNEQLLLNLVRLRYRDTPFFLMVGSVSSQYQWSASAGISPTIHEHDYDDLGFSLGLSAVEKPTVTYAPLQGERFVTQLLSPVRLETLLLLYHSGWSVERLFRCTVQRMNGVKNAPSASGPTPAYVPEYEDFVRIGKTLRRLQIAGKLDFGSVRREEETVIVLRIAEHSEEVEDLKRTLGLDIQKTDYLLGARSDIAGADRIGLVTRSLLGMMFYLSQAVEVPETDEEAGRVTVTRHESGEEFDWGEVTGDVFRVRTSRSRPRGAYVAVPYRGNWFYIDDTDLNSKTTFSLLVQLFALQSGEVRGVVPSLTLSLD